MRMGTIVLALPLLVATIMPGKFSAQRGPNMTLARTDAFSAFTCNVCPEGLLAAISTRDPGLGQRILVRHLTALEAWHLTRGDSDNGYY
jgi:hypothetical protein